MILRWSIADGLTELSLDVDDSSRNFLDAVDEQLGARGFDADRIARWRYADPNSPLAATVSFRAGDRFSGPVFIPRDTSAANVLALHRSFGSGAELLVSPNDGVGGDEVWQFVVTIHENAQVLLEFVAYFQFVRFMLLTPRRNSEKQLRNEVRIAAVVGQISPQLREVIRSQGTWTSSELEQRFKLSFESVAELLKRCGFSPRADRINGDVVWYRDLD